MVLAVLCHWRAVLALVGMAAPCQCLLVVGVAAVAMLASWLVLALGRTVEHCRLLPVQAVLRQVLVAQSHLALALGRTQAEV